MRTTPSLRSFPNVALETVPMLVSLTMALSRLLMVDCRAIALVSHRLLPVLFVLVGDLRRRRCRCLLFLCSLLPLIPF